MGDGVYGGGSGFGVGVYSKRGGGEIANQCRVELFGGEGTVGTGCAAGKVRFKGFDDGVT